jgi:cytoskeletal protein RodZ
MADSKRKIKMTKSKSSLALALLMLFVLACTCGKTSEFNTNNANNSNNSNSSGKNENKSSNENKPSDDEDKGSNSNKTTTGKNESTGIAECDAYLDMIEKYLNCPNVPESSREAFRKQREQTTKQIRETAKNDTGKTIMAGACKQMTTVIEEKLKEECK